MRQFFNNAINECKDIQTKVTDRSSGALIKNIVLVLTSILTLGIALGIYTYATKESRAKSGHFFFTNESENENQLTKLQEVMEKLSTLQNDYFQEEEISHSVNSPC